MTKINPSDKELLTRTESSVAKRIQLRHPALVTEIRLLKGSSLKTKSILNLKKEGDVLRFGAGLFSVLTFLEEEGWPIKPSTEDWVLDSDNLPRLKPEAGQSASQDIIRDHAALLYALFTGSKPPREGKVPSLPRRHRHFSLINSWMALTLGESESFVRKSARTLLHELFKISLESGYGWKLPASWGLGVKWQPSFNKWPRGWNILNCPGETLTQALIDNATLNHDSDKTPVFVNLGEPSPYPYAALEPVLKLLLGSEEKAREWLSAQIKEGDEHLVKELSLILKSKASDSLILYPGTSLDAKSLDLLHRAVEDSSANITVLDAEKGMKAGQVESIKPLWLSTVAADWYMEHSNALFGDDNDRILMAFEKNENGEPSWGSPLLPPLSAEFTKSARASLGNLSTEGKTGRGKKGSRLTFSRFHEMEQQGHLADLYVGANCLRGKNKADAEYWEGVVLLQLGQPQLALKQWKDLAISKELAGQLVINRALSYERLGEFDKVLSLMESSKALDLSSEEEATASMICAQSKWIAEKNIEEAFDLLSNLEKKFDSGETPVRVLCYKATIQLFSNRVDEASALLARARELIPENATPVLKFILLHRTAVSRLKLGMIEEALSGFEMARETLQRFGFRGLEAACECECGNALRLLCRFDEAAEAYRRGMEGAESLGLEQLAEDATFNLAVCTLETGRVLETLDILRKASRKDDPSKNALFAAIDCYWLATALQQIGNYPESLSEVETGLEHIKDLQDSSVAVPLLVLRGDLLLQTGQKRKLFYLCSKLREALRPETEADDRLAALALFAAASLKGVGEFSSEEYKEAIDLLPRASAQFRSMWHLFSKGVGDKDPITSLYSSWDEAKKSRNPYFGCRALKELADREALPDLSPGEREWLCNFLISNRAKGPEKDLLPLIKPKKQSQRGELNNGTSIFPGLLNLASPDMSRDEDLKKLMKFTGADGVCIAGPNSSPKWWGKLTAGQRRDIIAARGNRGDISTGGGSLFGTVASEDRWIGLFRSDSVSFNREESAYAMIWAKMLKEEPSSSENIGQSLSLHPAISRLLIADSPSMRPILEAVQKAAAFHFPVLITGEPGVGKEICAKALHAASERASRKWIAANCANLTPTLATSLLFGHKKGSFTGADRDRVGLAEAARDSTLFMDEVGELPTETQANLLRFLQDGTYLPLGEVHTRNSNARIIAATNRNLAHEVREGGFREDLFHRLNVIHIKIPPLRQRTEDIKRLLEYFLRNSAEDEGLAVPEVKSSVISRLLTYPWPGNVRELQNTAKVLLVASAGSEKIEESHLPGRFFEPAPILHSDAGLSKLLIDTEIKAIKNALDLCGGNLTATAKKLRISRQSLSQKIKRHRIERK